MEDFDLICSNVEKIELDDNRYKLIYYYRNFNNTFHKNKIKIYDRDYYDEMIRRNNKSNKRRAEERKSGKITI